MTAAIASQCALHQSPASFWKMHDAIFDAQDVISASNVWDKMQDIANQLGLKSDEYKTCAISPEAASEVKSTVEEGHTLAINATPTTFVNNRRVVGPDKAIIEQYIEFNRVPW
jgi:protein-disulfide isomerase